MKVSGFTIVRNITKFNYPMVESINSILPICDEFIINVGESEDETLEVIRSIDSPKIRIIETKWDMSEGKTVLSKQTNVALKECSGDWAFYLQADEVIHEDDLPKIKSAMEKNLDSGADVLRFEYLHFYGSYFRFRDDRGWYQKQHRVIRNNGEIESIEDAYSFERKDRRPLKRKPTGAFVYHYGWVNSDAIMREKITHHRGLGMMDGAFERMEIEKKLFKDIKQFPIYFGSHPAVMKEIIASHALTKRDADFIVRRHFLNPFRIIHVRHKKHRGLFRKSYERKKTG